MLRDAAMASPLAAFFGAGWIADIPWGPISYLLASIYTSMLIIQLAYKGMKWFKAKRHGKHPS